MTGNELMLMDAVSELKVTLQELRDQALAKQRQRAEPWQQTTIDMVEKSLKRLDVILKREVL